MRVRKYEVDKTALQECLKSHKNKSNKQIAEILNVPKTTVDHWFRRDSSFSIPDANIWFDLKKLLEIDTDEFDKPITEFVWDTGKYEMAERCYLVDGLCPTITCGSEIKIIELKE